MSDKFILKKDFENPLSYVKFLKAKKKYCESINNNQFSMIKTTNLVELIKTIKRTPDTIGPYKDLTPFEALNRIGSDLVLLSGAEQLFNNCIPSIKPDKIQLNMGNKAGYDVIIYCDNKMILYGEAFNAAASFCKSKMRQSIDKLLEGSKSKEILKHKRAVVFYNEDVRYEIEPYLMRNKKIKSNPQIQIHSIACDYESVTS